MCTERQIESELIDKLTHSLGYIYRQDIVDRDTLEANFRKKFEKLNQVNLSDREFKQLLDILITPDVYAASKHLRQRNTFMREDGTPLQYTLVNTKDWCHNDFEVCHQLRINTRNSFHKYDVVLLINGLPIVQIELKNYTVNANSALNQILKYKNDEGSSYTNTLMCFVQLFVVSNKTYTRYFANNNLHHLNLYLDEAFLPVYEYATPDNQKINYLPDFAEAVLAKCLLAKLISRYMVLMESEQKLLIMRPYQIYAVENIIGCVNENRGNGYIWHTTGSGKTLTSFKAATLLKDNPEIEKCLFVVDRKDLDRQTRDEFNKFQEGCVEENTSTKVLIGRMLSTDYADKVIVTTIQKLGIALDESNKQNYRAELQELAQKRIVFIFDECHRSQFGENHEAIKNFFPKAQLFGFTGTPIFDQNATYQTIEGTKAKMKTTKDIFEKQLHAYTITNAIDDKNVLRFQVNYFRADLPSHPDGSVIKKAVVNTILSKHDAVTNMRRFNALFATASINDAIEYYELFKEIQAKRVAEDASFVPLNIACVFSPPAETDSRKKQEEEDTPQENADNQIDPNGKKEKLSAIIADYNKQYNSNYTIGEFDFYYKDVQKRIKEQQYPDKDYPHKDKIDITIVVDMLLTGFDSKYLNTLYVDKNLKYHGLVQAFSRTNRTLNNTKPHGIILDFRGQQEEVNQAIILFSGLEGDKAKEIWFVEEPEKVIAKYKEAVQKLEDFMQAQGLVCAPQEIPNLKGDEARIDFINIFKEIQGLKTKLGQYADLTEEQLSQIEACFPEEELRAFKTTYLDTAQNFRKQAAQNPDTPEEIKELDFEFVLFASAMIDDDYIASLVSGYTQAPKTFKVTPEQIIDIIGSNADMLEERDYLIEFVYLILNESKTKSVKIEKEEFHERYEVFRQAKIRAEKEAVCQEFGIAYDKLETFIARTVKRLILDTEDLEELLADEELGWKERGAKEKAIVVALTPLLKKLTKGQDISGLSAYV